MASGHASLSGTVAALTALAAAGVPRGLRMRIAGYTREETQDGYNHDLSRIRDVIEGLA